MKCAIYVRVSTEEQALEGYSISAQKQRLKSYCDSQDWDIVGFYVDEGISAKNMNRPELQRMLKHVEEGIVDCVLVYRLDRLTRSVLDLYQILDILDKHGCKFKSATEVYDTTTAIGRLFITLVAALAQWERENTGERIRMARQEKVRQGKYTSNRKPYGYNLNLETGELTIKEEEAQVVRLIFDLYNQGYSSPRLCRVLNSQQTPGRDIWNEKAVMYILTNPLYIGTLRWHKDTEQYFEVKDSVPAIIDEQLFNHTQKIMESRRDLHPRQIAGDYIFSGVLKCPKCGQPMVGTYAVYTDTSGERLRYKQYKCRGKKIGTCDMGTLSEKKLEKVFLEFIDALHLGRIVNRNTDVIQDELNVSDDVNSEIERIREELSVIEKRRKKWQYAWAEDDITDEEFKQRMKEENEKEGILKDRLLQLNPAEEKAAGTEEWTEILQNIRDNWENMEDHVKKSAVQIILKKLVVDRLGKKELRIEDFQFN